MPNPFTYGAASGTYGQLGATYGRLTIRITWKDFDSSGSGTSLDDFAPAVVRNFDSSMTSTGTDHA